MTTAELPTRTRYAIKIQLFVTFENDLLTTCEASGNVLSFKNI